MPVLTPSSDKISPDTVKCHLRDTATPAEDNFSKRLLVFYQYMIPPHGGQDSAVSLTLQCVTLQDPHKQTT